MVNPGGTGRMDHLSTGKICVPCYCNKKCIAGNNHLGQIVPVMFNSLCVVGKKAIQGYLEPLLGRAGDIFY